MAAAKRRTLRNAHYQSSTASGERAPQASQLPECLKIGFVQHALRRGEETRAEITR